MKKLNCILLIDDDEGTNFLNKFIIEKTGIAEKVDTVYNGKEALEYLTNTGKYSHRGSEYSQPALIILDINMPIMDGWEFINAYNNLDDNQKGEIVIVMLSTSENPDDIERAQKLTSISEFRNKPLTIDIIEEIFNKYFSEYI
ncbi:response regulator [Flavobacterium sp. SUN046]|uniref:response regulator n=1 Tax=Flavobacterium sp. SUN046 TaxID=3002440 RepID=UPI002DB8C9EA|nr:response regulator [Flavobacterium sp. SUN046]MEC4048653.1 response regulator [Flavobacterium sp. SUN046]